MIKFPIRIAIVGIGKIARDQHIPAILSNPDFELVALISRSIPTTDFPVFASLEAAFDAGVAIDAVAICTPPSARTAACHAAASHGCAILLEKPPAGTGMEALTLKQIAYEAGVQIFASWHSRFAPMIEAAGEWCASHRLQSGQITWYEDAAKWHPGQDWLWRAGGFGVFDPGINALSILSALYPVTWQVQHARLHVPENVEMPVRAQFDLSTEASTISVDFDFRSTSTETWSIHLVAQTGATLDIVDGGAGVSIDGAQVAHGKSQEYAGIYRRFSELVKMGASDFDISPLAIVEDVFSAAHVSHVESITI
ncbi:Gfo/Idh/MocA family oxidoreductase [Hyphomonas sp.]|uniref:Gfo/Idh/MocA family protein n=1 Tax=Hyphomonas sp. TaxID=87 RepID=UPI0032EE2DC8